MKLPKRFMYLLSLALISFLMANCQPPKPDAPAPACCGSKPNPSSTIDTTQAKAKINLFLANQYQYITTGLNANYPSQKPGDTIKDNQEVWFDLENLKEYICYVEQASEGLGYTNLGLRVYFGATQDSDNVPMSTVLFWPTHNDESTKSTKNSTTATPTNSNNNENSYEIQGMNYGGSGRPPKKFGNGN